MKNPRCRGDFSLSDKRGFATFHDPRTTLYLDDFKFELKTESKETNYAVYTHILRRLKINLPAPCNARSESIL